MFTKNMKIYYATFSDINITKPQDFQDFIIQNNIHLNKNYYYTVSCILDFNEEVGIRLKFTVENSDTSLIVKYLNHIYDNFNIIKELAKVETPIRSEITSQYDIIAMSPHKMEATIKILDRFKKAQNITPIITTDDLILLTYINRKGITVRLENILFKYQAHNWLKNYYLNFSFSINLPEFSIIYRYDNEEDIKYIPTLILKYLSVRKSILNKIDLKKSELLNNL